jgi:hypothetical protein
MEDLETQSPSLNRSSKRSGRTSTKLKKRWKGIKGLNDNINSPLNRTNSGTQSPTPQNNGI